MRALVPAIVLSFLLAACAGPGGVGPSGGLMYQVPQSPEVVYLTGDTTNIDIDAGPMGSLRMRATGEAALAVSFDDAADGVRVTARFQELKARLTQPMGGAQSATEADVEGDIVFTMDSEGRATVVSLPETRGAAGQLANPNGIVYEFFPMLPGHAVNAGDSWTDTLQYTITLDEGDTENTSILTYTLQGDTMVDGRNLLLITLSGESDVVASGITEGMEVIQVFSGDVDGTILWDPARNLYLGGVFNTDMDGTVEVPAAGMPPMPMTVRGISRVKLQGN